MPETYTMGVWVAKSGQEDDFMDAWAEFAAWAAEQTGSHDLRLLRDRDSAGRFVSFGDWDDIDAVHAWKATPEFRRRMAVVQQHVEAFEPSELTSVRIESHQPA